MGSRLARYAAGPWWAHLDHAPRMLLTIMALACQDTAHDGIPAGKYFASRDELLLQFSGIGPDDPRARSARRYICRLINVLIEAGAIEQIRAGRGGTRAEYAVRVDPTGHLQDQLPTHDTPVDNPVGDPDATDPRVVTMTTQQGGHHDHPETPPGWSP